MSELSELESIRTRHDYGRPFSPLFELDYRETQRKRYRVSRAVLFVMLALFLALGPGFMPVFAPAASMVLPLRLFGLALAALLLGTAAATLWPRRIGLTQVLQVIAVVVSALGSVGLHYLSLRGAIDFPIGLVGCTVVSIAFFGAFSWRRIVVGAVVCFVLVLLGELHATDDGSRTWMRLQLMALMTVIAVMGVYLHEYIARVAWVAARRAAALAGTDPLTGLSTRAEFNQVYASRIAQARRDMRCVGLMLIDVDHFKQINDGYGHLFGDEVLRSVGACIIEQVARRPMDLRVRFGGEEILVLWYDVEVASIGDMAEQVLHSIRQLELFDPGSRQRVRITASAGVTWLVPRADTDPLAILKRADELLYRAKRAGRNQAVSEAFGEVAAVAV